MTASSGEIQIIIAIIAMTVSSEVSSWLRVCCRLCATLSMSLVTRLSSSPRGWLVEVGQRQPVELVLDVAAQPVDGAVHRAGEHPALHPLQQRGDGVQRQTNISTWPSAVKSMPWPGTTGPSRRACRRGCPGPRPAAPSAACCWVTPAGICVPKTPAKIRSVAPPRIFGPIALSTTLPTARAARRSAR